MEVPCFSIKMFPSDFSDDFSFFNSAVPGTAGEDRGICMRCGTSFSPTHPRPNLAPGRRHLSIFLDAMFQATGPRLAANLAKLLA